MNNSIESILSPTRLGGLSLRNSIIKAGCFEGMSQGGYVTEKLIEHHRRIAEGGVGMTTVAYCSVSFDGRAFDHEIWMREEIIPGLKKLTDAVHKENAAASIQLGHCGYFANKKAIRTRPIGPSAQFNLYQISYCREMTEDDIQQKINEFGEAARMAMEAGLDAVEVHAGHGYLLSQFLSPYTNHRKDKYGGELKNRMRFPEAVVREIRRVTGPDFPILVKMNQRDGMKGGLEIEESVEVAKMFESAGASAIIPSCGFTSKTPLYMLRGNVPVMEMVKNKKDLLTKVGLLLFGKALVQEYAWEPLFLMEGARKIQDAINIPVVYIGGVLNGDDIVAAQEKGFSYFQIGRALIHNPDFVDDLKQPVKDDQLCDTCNRCVAAMDAGGVYCVSKEIGYLKKK